MNECKADMCMGKEESEWERERKRTCAENLLWELTNIENKRGKVRSLHSFKLLLLYALPSFLPSCFLNTMMNVEKSQLATSWRNNVCHISSYISLWIIWYEIYWLLYITTMLPRNSGTVLSQYIICDNWKRPKS